MPNNNEDLKQKQFNLPDSFLYGAASAAHQVEGNNIHSDWWHEEQKGKLPKSGIATDHYNRYAEDFGLAKQIGLNAMRISIEWARIEPVFGHWDMDAIMHYRNVLKEMKTQGLTRMVTLLHFTLPLWMSNKGGFGNREVVSHFERYAKFIAQELGDEIDLYCTINEPEVYTYMSTLRGMWPPFSRSPLRALNVFNNLAKAHNAAYQAIKSVDAHAQIGMAKNNVYNEAFKANSWLDQTAVQFNNWFGNHWFLNKIQDSLDFIGLNYYFYHSLTVNAHGIQQKNLVGPKSDMGWRTFPEGIYHLLIDLAEKYHKPLYITENGIANAHDDMRKDFIREHLFWVNEAIKQKADVRGYFYWSLTDTYEWHDGYGPKFGLIEVDFPTQKRTIRPSANIFKQLQNKN